MHFTDLLREAPAVPGSLDRSVPIDQTRALVPRLRERYGITRIADITYLDRIGIPVVSAIAPDSNDLISVYNGKGPTRDAALVGAVMEAVERAQATTLPADILRIDARTTASLISPPDLGAHARWVGPEFDAVHARDLVADQEILVPIAAVCCPWRGERVLRYSSTNGLAAGNTLAEAIFHAWCELIERHLWSVAHAQGHLRPMSIASQFTGAALAFPVFLDDPVAWEVSFPTGIPSIDELAWRISRCGLSLHLRCVEIEPFPFLFSAVISDRVLRTAHSGLGCSWSPEHAAVHAITEAAQSRASDFQAAREDLLRPNDPRPTHGDDNRRTSGLPTGRWYYDAPTRVRELRSFENRSQYDVGADLAQLISAFRQNRLGPVAVVDLSPVDLPIHVVRVIAPALETAMIDERIGPVITAILDLSRTASPLLDERTTYHQEKSLR